MEPKPHNWSCEETETRLSDYLDGTIRPPTRAELDAHAEICASCAALISKVSTLVSSLEKLGPLVEPPSLTSAILDATLGPRRKKTYWKAWFGWLRPFSQPRFAYGAVSVMVTTIVISQALGVRWRAPVAADLNPTNVAHVANRQVHQVYARGLKLVSDLRLVYEIQTRLQPASDAEPTAEPPAEKPGGAISPGSSAPQRLINHVDRSHPALRQVSLRILARSGRSTG
jgi:hypothetical protein